MRSLSAGEVLPSGVVKNASLPGASELPGVPSTYALIPAKLLNAPLPSAPVQSNCPRTSLSDKAVFEFTEDPHD